MRKRESNRPKSGAAPSPVPALEVVYRDLADLRPDPNNARTHPPEQIAQIRAMMDELGQFTNPILLRDDESTIGAGHGRHAAASLDPPIQRVPTITIRGLTDAQWRAYAIADNQLALNSGWDEATLKAELEALAGEGFDLNLIGFSEFDLSALLLDREEGANDPAAEWVGMPEFDQRDRMAWRSIVVHFDDQAGVDAFAKALKRPITEKMRYLHYPQARIEGAADKRWQSAGDE